MVKPYAEVKQVWNGGPNSLHEPQDMQTITLSRKEMSEFGGGDKEKLNFSLEYDVTELNYAANLSIAIFYDRSAATYQTNLKSVQGAAKATFRIPFLPKYGNMLQPGNHIVTIAVKLRPRWTVWHMIDNYKDFSELSAVSESWTMRRVVITE
jgi:hypothetical protein